MQSLNGYNFLYQILMDKKMRLVIYNRWGLRESELVVILEFVLVE